MARIETRPLLALETSGRTLGAALWGPRGAGAGRHVVDGARHGVALAVIIRELLGDAGLKPPDLSAVAVSLGPGSWTGLRIGLAAAKALAWGAGIGLVGVPSFEALAWAVFRRGAPADGGHQGLGAGGWGLGHGQAVRLSRSSDPQPTVPGTRPPASGLSSPVPSPQPLSLTVPVRNAYAEGIYAAAYAVNETSMERVMAECVLRAEELPSRVEEVVPAGGDVIEVVLCGDLSCLSAVPGRAHGAALPGAHWRLLEAFEEIPAEALAERAWARLLRGEVRRSAADIHSAAPLYLRASDPELKLQRKRAPSGC